MLQVLQQNKSFSDFLFFKELYFLPATSATSYRVGQKTHLSQVSQQNKSFSDFLFFKELYFLPATSATKASCGSGNTLGAGGAARNGYFQKSLFLREYCFYLLRLLHQKEGTKKHPWGSCGSKKWLFQKSSFLESLVFICHTCPKDRACHSKRSYSRQKCL